MSAPQKIQLPPRKKRKHGGFSWGTWFAGLSMGALSTWIIMSDQIDFKQFTQQDETTAAVEEPKNKDDIVDNLPIEFYKLLPNREEQIPVHIISQRARKASPDKPVDKPERYRLQAGSFQKLKDADHRRANILILGLDAYIEKVTHSNKTWHRVMLGPFDSLKQLEISRRRMHENNIDTIVLKIKN